MGFEHRELGFGKNGWEMGLLLLDVYYWNINGEIKTTTQ